MTGFTVGAIVAVIAW